MNHPRSALLLFVSLAFAVSAQPTVPGVTEAVHDDLLSSEIPGKMLTVHVKEGDRVKAGQVLVQLDDRLESLEANRRKLLYENTAELAAAKLQQQAAERDREAERRRIIRDSRAEVESAAERVKILGKQLESTRTLHAKTRSVSSEELEKRELEYKLARAEHQRLEVEEARQEVEYQMALVQHEIRIKAAAVEVERVQTAKSREKLEYDIARQQLERKQLSAPYAGIVAEVFRQPGEYCQQAEPLIRLVDISRCYFVAHVDTAIAAALQNMSSVPLEIDAVPKPVRVDSTVSFVSPVVDPASGLRKIKLLFANPDAQVTPGVTGRVILPATPSL